MPNVFGSPYSYSALLPLLLSLFLPLAATHTKFPLTYAHTHINHCVLSFQEGRSCGKVCVGPLNRLLLLTHSLSLSLSFSSYRSNADQVAHLNAAEQLQHQLRHGLPQCDGAAVL